MIGNIAVKWQLECAPYATFWTGCQRPNPRGCEYPELARCSPGQARLDFAPLGAIEIAQVAIANEHLRDVLHRVRGLPPIEMFGV